MKLHIPPKIAVLAKNQVLREILKFAVVFGVIFWVAFQKLDPDFGWHLQAGNYFRDNGMPATDIYSYTASNFHWINHEWGNDILVSFLYGWVGYLGLAAFFALLWTLALWISGRNVRFITLVLGLCAILTYTGVRALAWSVLFFSILLYLCREKTSRKLIYIPLLIFVWANFHGSFVLGLGVLLFYLLKKRQSQWIKIFVLSLLVSFINFNGYHAYVEVARTMFDSEIHFQIGEWHMFSLNTLALLFISLWVAGFWFFSKNKLKNWFDLPPILLAMSMSASRNLPLFVVASLERTDEYLGRFYHETLDAKGSKKAEKLRKVIVAAFIVAIVVAIGYFNRGLVAKPNDSFNRDYPSKSVAYLQKNGCQGNIFNGYDFGGYLIWKLPEYKVYIDGRMPSWRDESGTKYLDRYLDVLDKPEIREKEFEKYNIKCLVLGGDSLRMIESLDSSWEIVDEGSDKHYGLYIQR